MLFVFLKTGKNTLFLQNPPISVTDSQSLCAHTKSFGRKYLFSSFFFFSPLIQQCYMIDGVSSFGFSMAFFLIISPLRNVEEGPGPSQKLWEMETD